jgi:hypothetical protein
VRIGFFINNDRDIAKPDTVFGARIAIYCESPAVCPKIYNASTNDYGDDQQIGANKAEIDVILAEFDAGSALHRCAYFIADRPISVV